MAKSSAVDDAVARLVALRGQPLSAEIRAELAKTLAAKSNLVIAKAAKLVAEFRIADLAPEMIATFNRLIASPATADKGCMAKTELATTLDVLECEAQSVFLAGIHHFQPEPVWGGSADTAGGLRSVSAIALVRSGYRDILFELADLLMDEDAQARIGAAKALALTDHEDAAAMLRVKLLAGDEEPAVMAEGLAALLKLSPRKSLVFAARFLDDKDPGVQDAAAMAIGETRQKEALEILRNKLANEHDPETRRSLLAGIAMLRLPESLEFLLSLVATNNIDTGIHAIEALRLYRHDEAVRSKLLTILEERNEGRLRSAFEKTFS